jgi:iron complex outermembrane recepter protein
MMFRTALLTATAISGLVLTTSAMAQTTEAAAVAADEGLGEIVVTAQRRVENVQNVPVAVTVLSANTLDRNDVRDLSRVEILTPGFSFGRSGSDARPAIRGVRTENVGVSGDPTIGFFVDNIYRSRASQANEPFVDVERVEIQRGPQGTLYGRNTFGGNVSVTTARPTDDLSAAVNLTYGSYDRIRGDGFVNVPITDSLQLRVAGLREKMDGYVKGTTEDLDIYNRDTTYGRATLRFKPVDAFEAVLSYSYWQEKGTGAGAFGYRVGGVFLNTTTGAFDLDGQPFQINVDPPGRDGIPDAGGVDRGFPINTDPLFYPGDTKLEQDQKQHVVSLNLSADLGFATLRSITGYIDYQVFRNADNDFSLRKGNVDGQEDKLTALSQEVQLASNGNGPFQWILGYFFFEEDVKASIFSSCPTAARNTPGCAFAAGLPRTTSNAVFGQASYWVIPDRLRLTGGIRYTSDKKQINRATALTDTNQRISQISRTGQRLDFEFNRTTWRANAEYYIGDSSMVYATVSTGFRSGGFNNGVFANPLLQGAFGPEDVTAYEIGSKNRFFDNKVQLNLSAYRNEFRDLQVQNQFLVPAAGGGFTTTSIILNAAEAHSQGIEVEVQAVPVPGLNIAMSGTLMEAKYDDYRNAPAPANYTGFRDLTGNDVPYSPNFKLTGVVSYDFDLGGSGIITPQATLLWSGSYFNTDFNTVLDKQDAFAKLDLRLGWRSASDQFSAEVFVNNVTDQITQNRATFGSRGLNESFDAPRMFGVRVGARF